MAYLPYLSDEKLKRIVCSVVDAGAAALQTSNLDRNVVDPFAMLFEMAAFGLDEVQWEKNERTRQAQKTMINHSWRFAPAYFGGSDGLGGFGRWLQGRVRCCESRKENYCRNQEQT